MRVNFNLKSFERIDNQLHIKVSKNTTENIPFKLNVLDANSNDKKHIGMIRMIKR